MSITTNQQSLYNYLADTLTANSFNVPFRTDLFNSQLTRYFAKDTDGNITRFVPTIINDITGDYLNIPDANSTSNYASIAFDIFVGTQDSSDKAIDEFQYVSYENTLNAIEEFKAKLLAKYHPLGDAILYFGGEDSNASFTLSSSFDFTNIKVNLFPLNNDSDTEYILTNESETFKLYKKNGIIELDMNGVFLLDVPFQVGIENEITITLGSVNATLENTTLGESDTTPYTFSATGSKFLIGDSSGLEAKIKRIRMGIDSDYEQVDINTFTSDSELINSGDTTLTTSEINNCILWSENGNAIFSFGTLNPISAVEVVDGSALYQKFELEIEVFISNDVLFGNNFKYYLDDLQIYPIDRSHTFSTEIGAGQYINNSENEYIVNESARDNTLSFYYIPSKKLTKLLKHVAKGTNSQNDTYSLVIQYPFFQVVREVILDSGGTNPNINTLSTFTLTFKKADSNVTGD